MAGRRRVRVLLAVLVFFIVAFLFTKKAGHDARQYIPENVIGGGSVLRNPDEPASVPQKPLEEKPRPAPVEPAPVDPKPQPKPAVSSAKAPEPQPAKPTTEEKRVEQASPVPIVTPTPAAVKPVGDVGDHGQRPPWEDERKEEPLKFGQGEPKWNYPRPTTPIATPHWSKQPARYPLSSTIQLPTEEPTPLPRIQHKGKLPADEERLAEIKGVAKHAWDGYRENAFGADEVKPVSGGKSNPFNGWGATLVDSLDTLWIMGMKKEFEEAVAKAAKIDFTTSSRQDIPMFETTIRYMGGFLGAYDVSGGKYRILLDKAVELGEILISAFDTPNRMPETYYHWKPTYASQGHRAGNRVVLAELGSMSVEFTRLAQLTGEPVYYDAIARITNAFEDWQNNTRVPGMWPIAVDASGCKKPAQMATTTDDDAPAPIELYDYQGNPMSAGAPVHPGQHEKSGKATKTKNLEKIAAAQGSLHENAALHEPGVGKIAGFGDPLHEGDLDHISTEKDTHSGPDTMRKPGTGKIAGFNQDDDSELVAPKSKRDSSSSGSSKLTGREVCLESGLASPSKKGLDTFTLGGQSDSTYEYLPKEYLLLGGVVDQYRTMYIASAEAEIDKILYRPMTPDNLDILIAGDLRTTMNYTSGDIIEKLEAKSEHLTCFAGGMFAMGGKIFDRPGDIEIGRKLTEGCIWAYNSTTSGIMPEGFNAFPCEDKNDCPWDEAAYWEALDPYHVSRTLTQEPKPLKKLDSFDSIHSPSSPTFKPVPVPAASHKIEVAGAPKDILDKRDLDPISDPISRPESPPPPPPMPQGGPKLEPTHPDLPEMVPPQGVPPQGLPNHDRPYHPVPPPLPPALSHEEFVHRRIKDEGLPPGFVKISGRKYILRPEAIESVFYMYRITGEPYWREAGWAMWKAVSSYTRAPYGASAIMDVTRELGDVEDDMEREASQMDSMESFWLAETLKYFYLLFEDGDKWSLDEYVLNTEAHFLKRPEGSVPV